MFIFNADHHLIAAEPRDLERWGFSDIYEAARAFAEGSFRLDAEQGLIESDSSEKFPCDVEPLETLLGTWRIVRHREEHPADRHEERESTLPGEESLHPEAAALGLLKDAESPSLSEKEETEEPTVELPSEEFSIEELSIEEESTIEETREESREEAQEEEEFILDLLQSEAEESPGSQEPPSSEEDEEPLIPLMSEEESAEETGEEAQSSEVSIKEEEHDESFLPLSPEEESDSAPEEPTPTAQTELPEIQDEEEEEEIFSLDLLDESPREEDTEEVVELPVPPEPPVMPLEEHPETEEASQPAPDAGAPLMPLPESQEGPWEAIARRFQPDLMENARQIDLSKEEYQELLREFIEDSRQLRGQLLSDHSQERQGAVAILKDAIALLHLNPLDELLGLLDQASPQERIEIVTEYERLLDQIGNEEIPASEKDFEARETLPAAETPESVSEEATEVSVPPASAPEAPLPPREEPAPTPEPSVPEPAPQPEKAPEPQAAEPESETEKATPSGEVDVEKFLRGVQPIPIEFSLHIAAQELSLPEDLVLEFINDFDKQGHEYLPVLIEAYEKKDLPHLQKTAHMLKGAASNLRIEAMVDNLYALQYDNDIERAPERIRTFAGQLMSLDNYLEQMNSQGG